ncbi:MAG: hypothetical protein JNJ57_03740 [Saprospiraceae bacterium]|nr:hypothetical protein [Saprospiraceae bacterium]
MRNHLVTYSNAAFGLSVLFALAPIWLSGNYFVTGDGPCHSYNASVLLDWWQERHVDFYQQFYTLNPHFEPNWWTHAWLVLLQTFLTPQVAEKIFLSGYVLAFCFGFRYLIRNVHPQGAFMSVFAGIFCWHHLLQMGFFNYAWSLAGMFWVLGLWVQKPASFQWKHFLLVSIGWFSLYTMHPIGFAFTAVGVVVVSTGRAIRVVRPAGFRAGARAWVYEGLYTAGASLPALILTASYLWRQNWNHGGNDQLLKDIIDALATLTQLITMNEREHPVVNLVVFVLLATMIITLHRRWRNGTWRVGLEWLVLCVIALVIYLAQVGASALELLMPLRLQLLPWLFVLVWMASAGVSQKAGQWIMVAALICQSALLSQRLPAHRMASRLAEDYVTMVPHIEPRSVVMVVNYDFSGTESVGKLVGDRIWMFNHVADYIGAQRSGLIMSDNYEALLRYFPLMWRLEGDMYNRTAIDGIGFEDRPPRVDLLGFPKRSQGRKIDYVLVIGQTEADRQHERGKELMEQLQLAYHPIATSPLGSAVLYQLKQ